MEISSWPSAGISVGDELWAAARYILEVLEYRRWYNYSNFYCFLKCLYLCQQRITEVAGVVLSFDPKANSGQFLFHRTLLEAASVHVFSTFIVWALRKLDFCFVKKIGKERGHTKIDVTNQQKCRLPWFSVRGWHRSGQRRGWQFKDIMALDFGWWVVNWWPFAGTRWNYRILSVMHNHPF